jgi:orotidine-5'-phosphate decarboxylase
VDAGATVLVSASGIYQAPDKVEAARTLAAIARGDLAGSDEAQDRGRGAG